MALRSCEVHPIYLLLMSLCMIILLEAHVMPEGDKSFHLNNTATLTFDEGRTYCQAKGGALATIKTTDEFAFVMSLGNSKKYQTIYVVVLI